MEFHDIIQEALIKTIPKKKQCGKAKQLSEEALQIAIKRIEQQGEIRKPFSVNNEKKKRNQYNGKDQRSLQENQRYQRNISCKDGLNKGQKQYGPKISRRYQEEVARIHRTIKRRSS